MGMAPSRANGNLVLIAEPYNLTVIERLPVVVKLTIKNIGAESIAIRFSARDVSQIDQYISLVLTAGGKELRIARVTGVRGTMTSMPAIFPLAPGAAIALDWCVTPLSAKPLKRNFAGSRLDHYSFVSPGAYKGKFQLDAGTGEILSSNEFELRIQEASSTNARAGEMLKKEHLRFLEGVDVPPDEECYRSGRPWRKVDTSRFHEIQKIADQFPDSEYAAWIKFWQVYHHGSVDEGIEYARAHRELPLADNLFLHKVQKLVLEAGKSDSIAYDRADELLEELRRDFPDSDTEAASQVLKDRLSLKRGK
jgi:hypothetical protein